MLTARSHKSVGAASLRTSIVLTPRAGVVAIDRRGLAFDTRFIPGDAAPERSMTVVYVVLEGTIAFDGGPVHAAPAVFTVTETDLEGANGARRNTHRTLGEHYVAVELHLRTSDVTWPPRTPLAAPFFSACRRIVEEGSESDEELHETASEVLDLLRERGVVGAEVTLERTVASAAISRVWGAMRPALERLAALAPLKELGTSSPRQTKRDLDALSSRYPVVRGGWRAMVQRYRLKLAVLFLSAEGVTVATVAREVGYGSADAMGRAFRDAELPAPSEVQRQVRERASI